jgi:hypothetical protein
MKTLFARFLRAFKRPAATQYERPGFTAHMHCSACGTDRWGLLTPSARGTGLAAFRCDAIPTGKTHVTIYGMTRRFARGTSFLSFRHLSHRQHFELGAKVRATQISETARSTANALKISPIRA